MPEAPRSPHAPSPGPEGRHLFSRSCPRGGSLLCPGRGRRERGTETQSWPLGWSGGPCGGGVGAGGDKKVVLGNALVGGGGGGVRSGGSCAGRKTRPLEVCVSKSDGLVLF